VQEQSLQHEQQSVTLAFLVLQEHSSPPAVQLHFPPQLQALGAALGAASFTSQVQLSTQVHPVPQLQLAALGDIFPGCSLGFVGSLKLLQRGLHSNFITGIML
jgi:hypothetical protein